MNEKTRLRILGGIVLFALAVVVLGSLLKDLPHHLHQSVETPEGFVELAFAPISAPSKEIKQKLSTFKKNLQPQAKDPPASKKKAPSASKTENGLDAVSFDEKGIPVRWVVQVASLEKKQAADDLKQRLANKGFIAFTNVQQDAKNGIIHAVYVGPTLQQRKANNNKQEIDKLFEIKTIVRKWN